MRGFLKQKKNGIDRTRFFSLFRLVFLLKNFSSSFLCIYFIMCVLPNVCMYTTCMGLLPLKPQEVIRFPGTEVRDVC